MHPEVVRDTSGICPECGMNLLEVQNEKIKVQNYNAKSKNHEMKNHDKHAGHSTAMFLRKFWVSFVLTIPVVIYSGIVQRLLGPQLPGLKIENWKLEILIPAVLGSVVFFYGGWVFLACRV